MIEQTLTQYLHEKYENRKDKDNIFGVGISDTDFILFSIKYLLGDDWRVNDPLGHSQICEIALLEILEKHSKEFRKELKQYRKQLH